MKQARSSSFTIVPRQAQANFRNVGGLAAGSQLTGPKVSALEYYVGVWAQRAYGGKVVRRPK